MAAQKTGKYLEATGPGAFRFVGEVPDGAIDAHVHLGSYLRIPALGGLNLTGPQGYRDNLTFHINEIIRYGFHIFEDLPGGIARAFEGILDVPPFKTDLEGPGTDPLHLLTSIPSLFDAEEPCYTAKPGRPTAALIRETALALKKVPRMLKEANAANLKRYLEETGIEKAVVLPIETGRFSRFSPAVMDACRAYSELIPFCSVHPRHPAAAERLANCKADGAVGLKFHPEFQGVAPDSREAHSLFDLCRAYRLPVQCHTGGMGRGEAVVSHPDRYRHAVSRFRKVPFILCHTGLADHEAAIELAASFDNVYLETSGQASAVLQRAAKKIGSSRILFGTDWPLYHPAVPISRIFEAFPKAADRRKVFGENAKALFGLDEKKL